METELMETGSGLLIGFASTAMLAFAARPSAATLESTAIRVPLIALRPRLIPMDRI